MIRLIKICEINYKEKMQPIVKKIKYVYLNDPDLIMNFLDKEDNLNSATDNDWEEFVNEEYVNKIFNESFEIIKKELNFTSQEDFFIKTNMDIDDWFSFIDDISCDSEEFDDLQKELQKDNQEYQKDEHGYHGVNKKDFF